MAAVFIWQEEIVETRKDSLIIGVAAGVILLMKPTAFMMVFGLWGLAVLIGGCPSRGASKMIVGRF